MQLIRGVVVNAERNQVRTAENNDSVRVIVSGGGATPGTIDLTPEEARQIASDLMMLADRVDHAGAGL